MIPRKIVFVDSLPRRKHSDKLDRAALAYMSLSERDETDEKGRLQPQDELEEQVEKVDREDSGWFPDWWK